MDGRLARIGSAIFLVLALATDLSAREDGGLLQETPLVAFASDAGVSRLARATAKSDFPFLANQFEAQYNTAFCGPATAAIVLNATRRALADLPRDRSRFRPDDLNHMSAGHDPSVPRFTQDNVIKGRKTRSQVLGEPVALDGRTRADPGYQLRQLDDLLRANGLETRLVIVDEKTSPESVRKDLSENLMRSGDFVIVNYRRDAVGQRGGGHISPLAAYDLESDSFLVMDVNPAAAPWVWMSADTLIRGMRTFDTIENRGYILVLAR